MLVEYPQLIVGLPERVLQDLDTFGEFLLAFAQETHFLREFYLLHRELSFLLVFDYALHSQLLAFLPQVS